MCRAGRTVITLRRRGSLCVFRESYPLVIRSFVSSSGGGRNNARRGFLLNLRERSGSCADPSYSLFNQMLEPRSLSLRHRAVPAVYSGTGSGLGIPGVGGSSAQVVGSTLLLGTCLP